MLYEIWFNDDEDGYYYTFLPANANKNILGQLSKLIGTIEASSWNEAMAKYHEFMGWEPYVPFDESED